MRGPRATSSSRLMQLSFTLVALHFSNCQFPPHSPQWSEGSLSAHRTSTQIFPNGYYVALEQSEFGAPSPNPSPSLRAPRSAVTLHLTVLSCSPTFCVAGTQQRARNYMSGVPPLCAVCRPTDPSAHCEGDVHVFSPRGFFREASVGCENCRVA